MARHHSFEVALRLHGATSADVARAWEALRELRRRTRTMATHRIGTYRALVDLDAEPARVEVLHRGAFAGRVRGPLARTADEMARRWPGVRMLPGAVRFRGAMIDAGFPVDLEDHAGGEPPTSPPPAAA